MLAFKWLDAKYRAFEKYILGLEKTADWEQRLKTKNQFRLMLTITICGVLLASYISILYGALVPMPFLLVPSTVVGFQYKAYKAMRGLAFVSMTLIPFTYHNTSQVFMTPASILFTNSQVLIQTQSKWLVIAHLAIQVAGLYFTGMNSIINVITQMSPDELAKNMKIALHHAIIATIISFLTAKLNMSYSSNLLRRITDLKDNLHQANTQLSDQNSKLHNTVQMKDLFIYTFSHEMKNALNGLMGNLSLAYEVTKNTRVQSYLVSAKICGEVLANFIHNILDSGKIENGTLDVSTEKRDVMQFFENFWMICGGIIQNKRLQGHLEIEKTVPRYLELDEQRMLQVLLNLTSNAVKFTEKGRVNIRVSWQTTFSSYHLLPKPHVEVKENSVMLAPCSSDSSVDEFSESINDAPANKEDQHLVTQYHKKFLDSSSFYQLNLAKWKWDQNETLAKKLPRGSKGVLKIQVFDTGCGIASEDQAFLFQKFAQVPQPASQRKVGTGLGLWICKELAHRLAGDIKMRSVVGVGSVFEFTIRSKVPASGESLSSYRGSKMTNISNLTIERPSRTMHPAVNRKKTLIVDDDSFNVELLKNYLQKLGISYLYAYDGEEALQIFKKNYRDICFVLTDNFMPKKLGTEAAVEISAFLREKRMPSIPILCISGDISVSVGEMGITGVMQKPVSFERLKQEIQLVYPHIADATSPKRNV